MLKAAQYGAVPELVRVSTGVEDSETLTRIFRRALAVVEMLEDA